MTTKKVKIKADWLDNTIGFFSPAKKAERLRAKYKSYFLENVTRKYDGASRGRRTSGWNSNGSSASSETEASLHTLRNRSRDLRRNSGYISRGIQVITSNVVGKGIRVKFNGSKSQEKKINELWKLWAGSNLIDYDGRLNLNMLQDMACDAVVESGEILIRKRNVRPTRANPFPIQVQILESDFIDDSFGSFSQDNDKTIIQGIEFDEDGRRKSYKIFKTHPGSQFINNESMSIDAKNIIHSFRGDRPGQIRGIPWAAPIMMNIKDLEDYEDTQLVRQKIAACFTAFVVDQETGNGLTKEEVDDVERFEPGMIEKLSAGKNIVLANPPTVENYNEYISTMLHKVATGMGISYESLTGDLSQVNFSSARMGWLEMSRNITKWQNSIMIDQILKKIVEWFFEAIELMGVNTKGVEVQYITPAREMIDPTKETAAKIKAIRSGLTNWDEALLEQGKTPEEHWAQRKKDQELIDSMGFVLDSDPSKTNGTGASQVIVDDSENLNENSNED